MTQLLPCIRSCVQEAMTLPAGEHLVLDPSIRNWVVLPMVWTMILMSLLRNNIQQYIKNDKPIKKDELAQK